MSLRRPKPFAPAAGLEGTPDAGVFHPAAVMPPQVGQPLQDQWGRHKRKLRLSLTDRCNFHCQYCMPDHPDWLPKRELLSFEQLQRISQVFVGLGIEQIRLTGGEPLLRQGLVHWLAELNTLRAQGLQRISLSSNGFYLADQAAALKAAGLDDVNISLDSLQPARFRELTRQPLAPVLDGIAAAQAAGLPVKINTVLMRGHNDDEIESLLDWAGEQGLELRFIEYMPLGDVRHWQRERVVSEVEILQRVAAVCGSIEALPEDGNPARSYRLGSAHPHRPAQQFGVISTISRPFCQRCDRLRLTATGELYTCLFANQGQPLRGLLERPEDIGALEQAIRGSVWAKDAGYALSQAAPSRRISMHHLGG